MPNRHVCKNVGKSSLVISNLLLPSSRHVHTITGVLWMPMDIPSRIRFLDRCVNSNASISCRLHLRLQTTTRWRALLPCPRRKRRTNRRKSTATPLLSTVCRSVTSVASWSRSAPVVHKTDQWAACAASSRSTCRPRILARRHNTSASVSAVSRKNCGNVTSLSTLANRGLNGSSCYTTWLRRNPAVRLTPTVSACKTDSAVKPIVVRAGTTLIKPWTKRKS
mmetsp:Transcript_22526/g.38304  ORF Transcript_22526/g.38304 Transcript_22526/m.38304 type:complete len:222 (+) Transcript_22526:96-761(+)